jgi:hypothetical protein
VGKIRVPVLHKRVADGRQNGATHARAASTPPSLHLVEGQFRVHDPANTIALALVLLQIISC